MCKLNILSGTVPRELGNLTSLEFLDLGFNLFHGNITSELGLLINLADTLDLSVNQLNGTLPTEFGKLKSLENLILDRNIISGALPSEIGLMQGLSEFSESFGVGSVLSTVFFSVL